MSTTYSNFAATTAIHSGAQTRAMIPDLFRGLGSKRVVLFSDKGLEQAGVIERVAEIFKQTPHGIGPELVGIFTDIDQDASSDSVNRATQYAREMAADGLLALGGGSVIDAVKGVKFSLHYGVTDIKDMMPGGINYFRWPEAQMIPIPHITVPTTAGTGSEVSPIAVIYNEEAKLKTNIIHPFIASNMAVLDPDLTVGLPPFITAFTGFDALTHAIEALFSPKATPFTDAYALQTIRMIPKALPEAVKNGDNLNARMEMLQASTMGITAFSFSLSAIPVHNLAHAYGALFRIPHGLANAVFLPHVIESLPELYLPRIALLSEALGLGVNNQSREDMLAAVVENIRNLQQECGLPSDFADYDIPPKSRQMIVQAVESDPAGINFPIPSHVIASIGKKVRGEQAKQTT
ncbi:iron-containing alcohol dehydrogenase [Pueribacillus sp. YX66]|uniref:iron-containing alcohol dehydrogenase n=1 Tax=Pueribacillus sp. YX66 TaxID=3229242 RepID=UPI00358D49EA